MQSVNEILDSWDAMRLNIYAISEATYTLTNGTQKYTLGPSGAALTGPRPVSIKRATVITPGGAVYPIELVSAEEFGAITDRSAQGAIPRRLYNDNAFPNCTLWFWPVPNTAATVELFTWNPFTQFVALTDTFAMPPAYQRALVKRLAIELAPKFQRPVDPALASIAKESMEAVQGLNQPPVPGAAEEAAADASVPPAANNR